MLYLFWITDPAVSLTRQFALLVAVWTHGCIGIYMWLRYRSWWSRRAPLFAVGAVLLPSLAILGIVNAGWDTVLHAAVEPGFSAAHGPPAPGSTNAQAGASLALLVTRLQLVYIGVLAGVFVARAIRAARGRRAGLMTIVYRDGRSIKVPRGFSILEASRYAGVPHVSVCGGRGRCSTCRVRVWRGLKTLALPEPAERTTLQRIAAPAGVRLACQVRPVSDLGVTPLMKIGRPFSGLSVSLAEGRELAVTALYLDLRDFDEARGETPSL